MYKFFLLYSVYFIKYEVQGLNFQFPLENFGRCTFITSYQFDIIASTQTQGNNHNHGKIIAG